MARFTKDITSADAVHPIQVGKGDSPRNCFSNQYRTNYEQIDWGHSKKETKKDKDE